MNSTILIIGTVGCIIFAAVVIVAMIEAKKKDAAVSSKCSNTNNENGDCDGSHI